MTAQHNFIPEELLESIAEEWVIPEGDFTPDPLRSPQQQRAAAKTQIKEFLRMEKIQEQLFVGIEALFAYVITLSIEMRGKVIKELRHLRDLNATEIEKMEIENPETANFAQLLDISEETISIVQKAAWEQMNNSRWDAAEGIYTLLTLLCHNVFQFWFERGIACYYGNNYEASILSYLTALQYTDENPQIYLYLAASYSDSGLVKEAKEALATAKQEFKKDAAKQKEWEELLKKVQTKVEFSKVS